MTQRDRGQLRKMGSKIRDRTFKIKLSLLDAWNWHKVLSNNWYRWIYFAVLKCYRKKYKCKNSEWNTFSRLWHWTNEGAWKILFIAIWWRSLSIEGKSQIFKKLLRRVLFEMVEKQRYRNSKIGFYSFDIQTSKIEPFLEWQVRKSNKIG